MSRELLTLSTCPEICYTNGMRNLHATQTKLLQYIKANNGLMEGKSLRDIGEAIGIGRKPQVVSHHIKQLEKLGFLREDGSNYVVLDTPVSSVAYINLYSCTAECGPNGFFGNDTVVDRIPLPTKTFGITNPKDFFLIKARGDSMEPMVKEGDLVLAKAQEEEPSSGSIAIVVHENMPKMKKFMSEKIHGRLTYWLESINSEKYPREYLDEDSSFRVVGLVKGIISKPKMSA